MQSMVDHKIAPVHKKNNYNPAMFSLYLSGFSFVFVYASSLVYYTIVACPIERKLWPGRCVKHFLSFPQKNLLPEKTETNYVFTSQFLMVKFIYSEKATKFCEIFTLLLTGTT